MKLLFCIVAGLVALLAGALAIAACMRSGQISREMEDRRVLGTDRD